MIEPSTDSAANFNPSMPLLSEETDSQSEVDDGSSVVPPNSSSPDKPQSHSDTSYIQDPENMSDGVIQEATSSHVEDLITSSAAQNAAGHPALTSYTVVPESIRHDKENHMNELSDIQSSLDLTSHHQHSESTLETVAPSNERHALPEIQSALEQTVSIVCDHISRDGEILDSTPAHSNSTPEGTSEAAVEDNNTSDINHSSSSHLASDHSSHTSFGHISESMSQLSGSIASSQTEVATTLPSFTEISEGTSGISENVVTHKVGMNPTVSDEAIFENNSEMSSVSSSSQLQADCQAATSDEYAHRACYLQIPESTSAEEKIVTNNSSEQILDPSQITCNTQGLISFHKDFEGTSEVPETHSDLEPEKEVTFTSYPTESVSHNVTTDTVVPSESVSNVPHSMPLLVDEAVTEMSNDCVEPDQALGIKSPLREDDMEITEEIRLKENER
jgi:hypothetical protein